MKLPSNFTLKVNAEILLKPIQDNDAGVLFSLVNTNRDHLRAFLGWVDSNTAEADSLAFIQTEKIKLDKSEAITFAIYVKDTLAGLISLQNIDVLNQCACLGYWIALEYQGKGIVTQSTKVIIQYAFRELNLHRLELRCAVHNHKSKKVAEKVGFSKEGILKEAIFHYDSYFDAYIFGLVNKKQHIQ